VGGLGFHAAIRLAVAASRRVSRPETLGAMDTLIAEPVGALNPAAAPWLAIGGRWRGVSDPGRWAMTIA
jgi:hypothetical protein